MKWLQVFILTIAAEKMLELLEFAVVGASGNRLHAIISPFVNSMASTVGAGVSKAVHAAVFPAATLTSMPGGVRATQWAAAYLWCACFWVVLVLGIVITLYWHTHPDRPWSDGRHRHWHTADFKFTWVLEALCHDLYWYAQPRNLIVAFLEFVLDVFKKKPEGTCRACGKPQIKGHMTRQERLLRGPGQCQCTPPLH